MEARILRCSLIFVSLFFSTGAVHQTRNFTVTAPTPDEARKVGEAAEEYRRDLAQFWVGRPLPPWGKPCRLRVKSGALQASGETRFQFVGKEVLNWNMYVQGSMERILDSVLPHEINHTIFACHYRRPLPRWADEGAATLFEHRSEQVKQLGLLKQVVNSQREFIKLDRLLKITDYPRGIRPMLILYAEGYALADFLVQQGGRQRYLKFLTDGHQMGWSDAIRKNYHHGGVEALEKNWKSWILAGMPRMYVPEGRDVESVTQVVSTVQGASRPTILDLYNITPTVRLQSPDTDHTKKNAKSKGQPVPIGGRDQGIPYRLTDGSSTTNGQTSDRLPGARRRELMAPRPRAQASAERQRGPETGPFTERPSGHTVRPIGAIGAGARFSEPNNNPSRTRSKFERPVKTIPVETAGIYESTGFADNNRLRSPYRKHLSRERSVISGSIPQWAGFPGQKELF